MVRQLDLYGQFFVCFRLISQSGFYIAGWVEIGCIQLYLVTKVVFSCIQLQRLYWLALVQTGLAEWFLFGLICLAIGCRVTEPRHSATTTPTLRSPQRKQLHLTVQPQNKLLYRREGKGRRCCLWEQNLFHSLPC